MAKRGAKGKYEEWLKPEKLEQIINWAAKGCTHEQIARNMGVSKNTFYVWLDKYYEIADAIKKGRSLSITCLENMAFKVAMGHVQEEIAVKTKDKEGNETVVLKKRTLPPNTAMLIFLLKNRAGYRDNPVEDYSHSESLKKAKELLAGVDSVIN